MTDLASCVGTSCVDDLISYAEMDKRSTALEDHSAHASAAGSTPNTLLDIHRAARKHAAADGTIVLLLATKGYADMLTNFLCSAQASNVSSFLVLTQDEEIRALAEVFNVGVYMPPKSFVASSAQRSALSDADFGTVTYQQLVFSRTELTMELLLLGFKPVIADVDTVWLSNPLTKLPWNGVYIPARLTGPDADTDTKRDSYDVAITDDSGEVCGCFIALRNTDQAMRFWRQVHLAHRTLIEDALRTGSFLAFYESEQKIVTQLLYKGGYLGALSVLQLPSELFPSGYTYFTLQAHRVQRSPPVVVHNNYIVGSAMKRARFQRYGLWSALVKRRRHSSGGEDEERQQQDEPVCVADQTLHDWSRIFADASRNTSIPSLNLYLPVHNSLVSDSDKVMMHVTVEGPLSIAVKGDKADFRFAPAIVYIDRNPPAHMEASPAVLAVFNILPPSNHSVLAFTVVNQREDVSINADVGFYRSQFAIDRAGRSGRRAARTVQYNQRKLAEQATGFSESSSSSSSSSSNSSNNAPTEQHKQLLGVPIPYITPPEYAARVPFETATQAATPPPVMIYSIRVITFNRPASLQRLLDSLDRAYYGEREDIALHIVVDNARTPEVCSGGNSSAHFGLYSFYG